VPVTQGLNPRRIARSLVTVLLLTLIQTVAAPILSPLTQVERAEAAPVSVAYASNTAGFNIIVPSGVFSVTLTARGAAGGKGGNDASAGLASTNVGYDDGYTYIDYKYETGQYWIILTYPRALVSEVTSVTIESAKYN
jgi:hypothetical protein